MRFPRIYTSDDGETHIGFRDMAQHEASIGPPPNPVGLRTEVEPVTGLFAFSIPAGTEVPSHTAPRPYICILLSGEGEVRTSDGATLRLHPGELVFCEDTHGKGHMTRSITACTIAFINRPDA